VKELVGIFALTLLSGCAAHYVHPTKAPSEYDKDYAACEYEAEIATAGMPGPSYELNKVLRTNDLRDKCMKIEGWQIQYE